MRKAIFASVFLALLLTGCGRYPEQGPMGTVETATQAAEQDGVLYFLYPVGPVCAPQYVLFYSREDLTETAEPEQTGMVHYLYLLDGTEIRQLGSYTQDYLYS